MCEYNFRVNKNGASRGVALRGILLMREELFLLKSIFKIIIICWK